jgi:trans-aconitate methyltransferase
VTTTTEAAFYDAAMTGGNSLAMLDLRESPWRPLYEEAARWIPANHPVVDLGCGTGRFLKALEREYHDASRTGIDFSPDSIAAAAAYLTTSRNRLEVGDLRDWQPEPDRAGNTTYVCLEVLEHLDDDLDLVARIPPGHQFVIGLPNYESAAHVRVFRSPSDIWERYGHLLAFRRWSLVGLDERKAIHCVDTVRRQDSW